MIDLKKLGLQIGQKLRLKTIKNEIIIGKFKKLSSDGTKIEISDPQCLDGSVLGKCKLVFKEDIQHIYPERLPETDNSEAVLYAEPKLFSPSIAKPQRDKIQRMMEEVVFINQADSGYYQALNEISENFSIGLHAENTSMGRIFKAEFLQISTISKLYVFDLRQLTDRLFEDLRPVLENQAYLKIIFESRLILDNLNTHYNLKIGPVCDLIVVFSIDRNTVFRDLGHCVQEIFGLGCILEQKEENLWKRPVQREQLFALSSKVAFLIPLYAQLNQLKVCESYGKEVDEYTAISSSNFFKEVTCVNRKKLKTIVKNRQKKQGQQFFNE